MRIEDHLSDAEYRDFMRLQDKQRVQDHIDNLRTAMRALPYGVMVVLVQEGLAARSEGNVYLTRGSGGTKHDEE